MNTTAQIETTSFEYRYAKKVADRIIEILSPHCDRIDIAGSIRRQTMYVKDIEIVCIPKKIFKATDIFGGGNWVVCNEFITAIDFMKLSVIKGTINGRYMQIKIKGDIKMDLFMPREEDYYRMLAVRTGSKEYSAKIIAHGWTELGWCGTPVGLRKKSDCFAIRNHEGKIVSWKCINDNGEKPPVWPSEESFFEWLGIRWTEPKYR